MPKPIDETLVDARWLQPPETMQRGPNIGNRHGTRMETDAGCVILIRLAHAAPDGKPGTIRAR
jgi:hypothetical protein